MIFFVFAILAFIFSSFALYTYNGLSKKTAQYASNAEEISACGVSRGNISSGIVFSALMLVTSFLLMVYFGWQLLPMEQKKQAKSYLD